MQYSMLKTKLAPPRYTRPLVERRRAIDRLDEGIDSCLTIIRAPAGYGKTTLAAQWRTELISKGRTVAWFSLDAQDNDLGIFINGLGEAIVDAGCEFAKEVADLYQRGNGRTTEAVISALANDMAEFSTELHIFLDDLHCLNESEIFTFLSQLMLKAPANMHFIVISRVDPDLSLTSLRLRGHVNNIDITDLRFDFDEAKSLLESRLKSLPNAENLRILLDATEGWATAIQWATIAVSRNRGPLEMRGRFLDHDGNLLDSFPREIMDGLPENIESFLLQTSILERFNEPLAHALTGMKDCTRIIDQIERENFPLLPLEGEPGWYRYHPLFCSFLRDRLLQRYVEEVGERAKKIKQAHVLHLSDTDGMAELLKAAGHPVFDLFDLHRRAAEWHNQMGIADQAVHHYLSINDVDSVLGLLEECTTSLLEAGRLNSLMSLAARLPAEAITARPRLKLNLAWCYLLTCRTKEAALFLNELSIECGEEGKVGKVGNDDLLAAKIALGTFLDDTAVVKPYTYEWDKDCDSFNIAAGCNAVSSERIMAGDYDEVRRISSWVEQKPELRGLYFPFIYRQCILALSYSLEGQFEESNKIVHSALMLAEQRQGRRSAPACVAVAVLSEGFYEQNRLNDLCDLLANRFDVINESVFPDALIRAYINAARTYWALKEKQKSSDLLDMLYSYGEEKGHGRVMAASLAENIRQLLSQNRLDRARILQDRLELFMPENNELSFNTTGELVLLIKLSRVRFDMSLGYLDSAIETLDQLLEFYENIRRRRLHVRIYLMRATAKLKIGAYKDSLEDFVQALTVGEDCGLVRSFLDERRSCEALLKQFSGSEHLPRKLQAYLEGLLEDGNSVMAGGASAESGDSDKKKLRTMVEKMSMSPKEMEILNYLGQGLPNKRIALAMDVSVETIRWHMKNIFSKLGVNDRHDATSRARILGLI